MNCKQLMADTENTDAKQKPWLFQPGQSGNPAGKPKGAKHRLQEDFVKDVQAAWETSGPAAIDAMIADKPGDFVKMVASLMPKEATLTINDHSELTDAELADRVRALAAQLAPFLADGTGAASTIDASEAGKAIASRVH